ncbi:PEP-utilizing enzyme [Streptomyces spectabilis]|uniref:Phosphoenolpyruvate synthase/pyruvate phosphate dikinase n=1 Tax=Streptomyces spectabilis TaxID=68270 RepID=A0A7W8EZQ2_STRST|nr:PEP-utilizing enzyme [Streptomyces spectabilis]MBB5109663.1 phosphoenolpyruvate synthase/pyruvate phosphate dikinase [Streptomyces spectabilis]GGV55153.1 hypothetical protein GCM10010245_87300 [Streptomyces spectabilis]
MDGAIHVLTGPTALPVPARGSVLVCRATDPNRTPLIALAGALVIDLGTPASHGAIIARELAIPCVIGTGDGTRLLTTGDRVHVDGSTGVVRVLQQATRSSGRREPPC